MILCETEWCNYAHKILHVKIRNKDILKLYYTLAYDFKWI